MVGLPVPTFQRKVHVVVPPLISVVVTNPPMERVGVAAMGSEKVAVMVTTSLWVTMVSVSVLLSETVGGVVSARVLDMVNVRLSDPL